MPGSQSGTRTEVAKIEDGRGHGRWLFWRWLGIAMLAGFAAHVPGSDLDLAAIRATQHSRWDPRFGRVWLPCSFPVLPGTTALSIDIGVRVLPVTTSRSGGIGVSGGGGACCLQRGVGRLLDGLHSGGGLLRPFLLLCLFSVDQRLSGRGVLPHGPEEAIKHIIE